jgi:hypothetical protein
MPNQIGSRDLSSTKEECSMGVICCLAPVDGDQINELLADPESVSEFLEGLEEEEKIIDLDKSWHGIHFLLTGSAEEGEEPLCYLVKGGEEIGYGDIDFGPPRALRPNQIAGWANALSAISTDDLRKRYDAKAMMEVEIYPTIWDRVTEEDGYPKYLLENYEGLRSFVGQMKNENKGAIIYFM